MHERPQVLIVEDDPQISQAIRLRLGPSGFDILAAENAEQGLDMAERSPPDVIVMDIQLPDMDGLTAMRKIHDQPATRETPVVVLSACSAERNRAMGMGARYFLDKPFSAKSLIEAINASLRRPGRSNVRRPSLEHAAASIHDAPTHT